MVYSFIISAKWQPNLLVGPKLSRDILYLLYLFPPYSYSRDNTPGTLSTIPSYKRANLSLGRLLSAAMFTVHESLVRKSVPIYIVRPSLQEFYAKGIALTTPRSALDLRAIEAVQWFQHTSEPNTSKYPIRVGLSFSQSH